MKGKDKIIAGSVAFLLIISLVLFVKVPVSANSPEKLIQNQTIVEQNEAENQVEAIQGEEVSIEDEETPLAPGFIGNDASQLNFWWWIFLVLVVSGTFCCVRMERSERYGRVRR